MLKRADQMAGAGVWIQNDSWVGVAPGFIHGMLTRGGFDSAGKLSIVETIERAGPLIQRIVNSDSSVSASPLAIVSGNQVHDDRIAIVARRDDLQAAKEAGKGVGGFERVYEFPSTDALVTPLTGLLFLIQTADCLPILFWDRERRIIGACHCGWRGLMARLAQKTAKAMIGLGARAESLEAWMAPGVRVQNYEVSGELVEQFANEFTGTEVSPDGRHLDLARIAISQMIEAGMPASNIADSGLCTFADAETFHSYRRDGARSGRLLTVIGMTG